MKLALPFKGGGSPSGENLTATSADVKPGKKFYGKDSDDVLTGAMSVHNNLSGTIGINGTYDIPVGLQDGKGEITQSIPTQGATSVEPMVNGVTEAVNGKYMTGNVTVEAVYNFNPSVIKKGVTVGEGDQAITGTFEGFVS